MVEEPHRILFDPRRSTKSLNRRRRAGLVRAAGPLKASFRSGSGGVLPGRRGHGEGRGLFYALGC